MRYGVWAMGCEVRVLDYWGKCYEGWVEQRYELRKKFVHRKGYRDIIAWFTNNTKCPKHENTKNHNSYFTPHNAYLIPHAPFHNFADIADDINSAAATFNPPPTTSISASFREGLINSSYMGRTVL